MLRVLALATALLALAPGAARACSVCGCGDPLLPASDQPSRGGELRVALETEALWSTAANEATPAATDSLAQQTIRGTVVYGATTSLNLVLAVPLVHKSQVTSGGGVAETRQEATGLGDLDLGARWFVVDAVDFGARRRQSFALSAGGSLPTGADDVRGADGARLDQHVQPGTGGFGPYAGLFYRFEQGDWAAFASFTGRVRTENAYGYRYGNALLWGVQGQYQPSTRFAASLAVEGRHAAADRQDGGAVANTGGLVVAVTPGAALVLGGPWSLAVRAQLPVATHLVGTQSVGPVVLASVQLQAF